MQRVYLLCPDDPRPSGGPHGLYRVCDHLNAAGIPAWIVHEQSGYRLPWFDSATPVMGADDVEAVPGQDLLYIPEVYGPNLARMAPGLAKAIVNQNAFNTFKGYDVPHAPAAMAYRHEEVVGALISSLDGQAYLRYAFPELDVHHWVPMPPVEYTRVTPPARHDPLVTFFARKNGDDAAQVINLLASRGALDGFELVQLDGMEQEALVRLRARASVYLSFGAPEGFGTPPIEAMSCGSVVVGYHGQGGREYFTEEHGFPVQVGDIVGFAKRVEHVLDTLRADPSALDDVRHRAFTMVRTRYTRDAEAESVVAATRAFLSRAGLRCATLAA